ncbi:hypothetical protein ACR79B_02500 [Sphingobacterium spiritivorum]|uniref:hypothetical protein n=1 Tax=Sphingobacterium spiritivorum TaxID=258 RepID=UPI003DA2BA5F
MKPQNLRNIPNRQIAIKAKVDQRTVASYFNGNEVQFAKQIQIKKAIKELLKEAKY